MTITHGEIKIKNFPTLALGAARNYLDIIFSIVLS